jgi:hypothetical protein
MLVLTRFSRPIHARAGPFLATIKWLVGRPRTKSGANHILKGPRSAGRFMLYRIGLWTYGPRHFSVLMKMRLIGRRDRWWLKMKAVDIAT